MSTAGWVDSEVQKWKGLLGAEVHAHLIQYNIIQFILSILFLKYTDKPSYS